MPETGHDQAAWHQDTQVSFIDIFCIFWRLVGCVSFVIFSLDSVRRYESFWLGWVCIHLFVPVLRVWINLCVVQYVTCTWVPVACWPMFWMPILKLLVTFQWDDLRRSNLSPGALAWYKLSGRITLCLQHIMFTQNHSLPHMLISNSHSPQRRILRVSVWCPGTIYRCCQEDARYAAEGGYAGRSFMAGKLQRGCMACCVQHAFIAVFCSSRLLWTTLIIWDLSCHPIQHNSTHLTNPAADYGSYGYGEPYQGASFTGYDYGYDQSQFMAGGAAG